MSVRYQEKGIANVKRKMATKDEQLKKKTRMVEVETLLNRLGAILGASEEERIVRTKGGKIDTCMVKGKLLIKSIQKRTLYAFGDEDYFSIGEQLSEMKRTLRRNESYLDKTRAWWRRKTKWSLHESFLSNDKKRKSPGDQWKNRRKHNDRNTLVKHTDPGVTFNDFDNEVGLWDSFMAMAGTSATVLGGIGSAISSSYDKLERKAKYTVRRGVLVKVYDCVPLSKVNVKDLSQMIPDSKPGAVVDILSPYADRVRYKNRVMRELFMNSDIVLPHELLSKIQEKVSLTTDWRIPEGGIHVEGSFVIECDATLGSAFELSHFHIIGGREYGMKDNTRGFVIWVDNWKGPIQVKSVMDRITEQLVTNFKLKRFYSFPNKGYLLSLVDEWTDSLRLGAHFTVSDICAGRCVLPRGVVKTTITDCRWTEQDPIAPVITFENGDDSISKLLYRLIMGKTQWTSNYGGSVPDIRATRGTGSGEYIILRNVRIYTLKQTSKLYSLGLRLVCITHDVLEKGWSQSESQAGSQSESQAGSQSESQAGSQPL